MFSLLSYPIGIPAEDFKTGVFLDRSELFPITSEKPGSSNIAKDQEHLDSFHRTNEVALLGMNLGNELASAQYERE
jgi:hypothetical protein